MFNKITNLSVNRGFLQKCVVLKQKIEQFKPGPVGLLLLHNLTNEWFYNIVINKDVSVFPNWGNISDTFDFAKISTLEQLPFGISEVSPLGKESHEDFFDYHKELMKRELVNFDTCFPKEDQKVFSCTVFVAPSESTSLFHQWQKQRRIWWRKFSANPGRYFMTDIKNSEDTQHVGILAKYQWGEQNLESLTLNTAEKNFTKSQLQFKDGRKVCQVHSITSRTTLSAMFLNTVCDAFDEVSFDGKQRTMLRLHRKLAPYKISFSVTTGSTSILELRNLAMYLCRLLRTNNVSCLLWPTAWKFTFDAQYKLYDELGVPYNVVLNDATLTNGILHLRCRDTTLKEQVHVSEIVSYLEKLLKNY